MARRRELRLALGALLVSAPSVVFSAVRIEVGPLRESETPVTVRIVSLRGGSSQSFDLIAPGRTPAFSVDPSGAVATVEGVGLFAEPLLLAGSKSEESERIVSVQPSAGARISGKVTGEDGKPVSGAMRARIRSDARGGREAVEVELDCPLDSEGGFSCPIPAERDVDLRLRVRGRASVHLWERRARQGETLGLGVLKLVAGGSVIARAISELPGRASGRVEVRLAPQGSTRGAVAPTDERLSALEELAEPDSRGFVAFEGLRAGIYSLRAWQPGAVEVELGGIRVLPGAETEIREPLRLRAPIPLTVFVEPAYAPASEDWSVELWRSAGAGFAPMRGAGGSTEAGVFVARDLAVGTYRVDVRLPAGGLFASEVVEVSSPSTMVTVGVDAVEVEGVVRLGEEPLWSRVTFGNESGGASVWVDTDEDGRFAIVLPREGPWPVRVGSTDPDVQRVVENVEVRRLPGSEKAFIEIELPGTKLLGRVVDERGARVPDATVVLSPSPFVRAPEQTESDEEGEFTLEGVEPGSYRLNAEVRLADGSRASGRQDVEIAESNTSVEIEVTVRRKVRVRGRVVGPDGNGIPAALVSATVLGYDFGEMSAAADAETDVTGGFELELPSGTHAAEVRVQAPGHALRLLQVPLNSERELVLPVSPLGGGLEIEFTSNPRWLDWSARRPYLLSAAGGRLFAGELVKWAVLNGLSNPTPDERVLAPMLEPGDYTLCWLGPPGASGPSSCVSARVEALGWSRVRTP
jgi:hypothetical protein